MKKIWKDGTALGTMEIAIIASIVLIGGSVYALVHIWEEPEEYDECDQFSINWAVAVDGDNLIIEIIDVNPQLDLHQVQWSLLDTEGNLTTWEDPSGETLTMEGDLADVNFSQSGYDGADVQEDDKFYSQDPVGTRPVSINHTLCVIYMDVHSDGKISPGDVIWVRDTINGGPAGEGFKFRLWSGRCLWGKKYLPAV